MDDMDIEGCNGMDDNAAIYIQTDSLSLYDC
jgi:hypothetical protein